MAKAGRPPKGQEGISHRRVAELADRGFTRQAIGKALDLSGTQVAHWLRVIASERGYLTTRQAAERLGVRVHTVYEYVYRGELAKLTTFGKFEPSQMDRFAKERDERRRRFHEIKHGTLAGYRRPCTAGPAGRRCADCTRANREHRRRWMQRVRGNPPEHGTESSYFSYACRCDLCKAAGRRINRERRGAKEALRQSGACHPGALR